jgi:hypothetical protein
VAHEEEITEPPTGGGTTTVPPSGTGTPPDGDIDLMSLSCSDLKDLLTIVDNLILKLKAKYEDTPKLRWLTRRSIQHSIAAQLALRDGIKDAMGQKDC